MYQPRFAEYTPKPTDGQIVCRVCGSRKLRSEFNITHNGLRISNTCAKCEKEIADGFKR